MQALRLSFLLTVRTAWGHGEPDDARLVDNRRVTTPADGIAAQRVLSAIAGSRSYARHQRRGARAILRGHDEAQG